MVHQGFICSTFLTLLHFVGIFGFIFLTCWMLILGLWDINLQKEDFATSGRQFSNQFSNQVSELFTPPPVCLIYVCLSLWAFLCYNRLFIENKDLLQHWLNFLKQIIKLPVNSEMGNILVIYSVALFIAFFVLLK